MTPVPVKPAFQAPVKLWVLASSTFMLFTWSKFEVLSGGALLNGTDFFWKAASAAFRVFASGWLPISGSSPVGLPDCLN